ncbi:MAG TPA: TRAP transporter large permease subunit [Stellaceae bacterium]|nr:TRAP transporter large permease subunit [Stellaceae bacterium]
MALERDLAATVSALEGAGADSGEAAPGRRAAGLDRALALVTEVPAAALVALEIAVLFAGVVSRYVFHAPLTWSDELASILFLWLAMLGAVIALRRGEHMRLTAIASRVPARWRGLLETVAALVVVAFVMLVLLPAHRYVLDEWAILTPALEIHNSFRAAAIEVGAALMMVIALARLVERASLAQAAAALVLAAAAAAALLLARPALLALGTYNLVVFFVVLVAACVAIGVPIAFAFGVATLSYLALVTHVPLIVVMGRMDEGMSHIILLAVPLFVFLGVLIEMTGLARAMVDFLASLLGHVRGGLSYVLLGAMYLVSGISGSKAADMAAVAPVLFPEMKRRGAEPGELVALLSASGAMSETIPPSLVLITIGSVTGISIAALFNGGLVPAAVLALALVAVAWWRSRGEDLSGVARAGPRQVGRAFLVALPALVLPFIIRAAVVEGIATATEVSTIGIAYTALAGLFLYRQFDWRRLYPMLVDTASLSGAILLIIGTATAMAWALTQSGFSGRLAAFMAAVPGGQAGFMAVSILAFAVLGSVLEGIPAIVLFGPLLFPVSRALHIHDVHYAMVVILAMGLGLFAPPFGVGFYAACAIGRVSPDRAMARIWPYLGALLLALLVVAAAPWLSIGFL